MALDPEDYFPADYRQARRNFISACEKARIDSIARVHPRATGPDGRPLFIDSAAIGPRDARRALLLIAGTHGVEGYFGSAALGGLLRQGLVAPPGARIVLVHALNPYGFAWNRRVNEDNIDLNRNFVDHANPPDNPGYAALADAIAYEDADPKSVANADARLTAFARDHGQARLDDAIARGQYRFPKGLLFGGAAPSWSHQMLRAILTEDLARVESLVAIDFHTGLGKTGAGEMSIEAAPGSPAYQRARMMWGDMVASSETGESVSTPLTGTLDQALAHWLPSITLTFAALEIGTLPRETVFSVLRRDNWLHNFALNQELAGEIGAACRTAFCPDEASWKRQAFGHAQTTVAGALATL